jgi:uncharacterized protein with FMN-binding domain
MKNFLLFTTLAAVLVSTSLVGTTSCGNRRPKGPDTLKVNTTELCKDIVGFNGPTPVEIAVFEGVITEIKALPNAEGPRYMKMVEASGLVQKLVGLNLEEAKTTELDAVTGATFTSTALIKNIREGLSSLEKE